MPSKKCATLFASAMTARNLSPGKRLPVAAWYTRKWDTQGLGGTLLPLSHAILNEALILAALSFLFCKVGTLISAFWSIRWNKILGKLLGLIPG